MYIWPKDQESSLGNMNFRNLTFVKRSNVHVHCTRGESVVSRGKGPLAVRQLNVSVSHSRKERAGCTRLRDGESSNVAKEFPTEGKK